MRPRSETIRLGAREWPVRPLTLREVQEIEPILMSSAAETKAMSRPHWRLSQSRWGAITPTRPPRSATSSDSARNRRRHGDGLAPWWIY